MIMMALPGSVVACPQLPDRTAEMDALIAAARAAPNEMAGRDLASRMWEIWTTAPDEISQEMLDRGMKARRSSDMLGALAAFDDLVAYCPDYAEGYNQRAFVRFLTQDYAAAVADLDSAIDISPRHVAALSGLALSLMGLGRDAAAQKALRDALDLNPWLSERSLLRPLEGQEL